MNKWMAFSFLFVLFQAMYPAPAYTPFYQFCRVNRLTPKFNMNLNFVDVSRESNHIKLYLSMPYIVQSGSIYYMDEKVRISAKGEVELPAQTASKILELLTNPAPAVSGKTPAPVEPHASTQMSAPMSSVASKAAAVSSSSGRLLSRSSKPAEVPAFSKASRGEHSSAAEKNNAQKPPKNDQIDKKDYNIVQKDDFVPIDSFVIDPGHGGKDPGGLGMNGIKEKEIVMAISRLVFQELKKGGNEKIYFTRKDDRYVTLKERTDKTSSLLKKRLNPIFISIHGNISLNRNTDGLEVYSLSDRASDEEALSVETVENAGFSKSDVEKTESLSLIINDLLKDGIRRQSEELAMDIGESLHKASGTPIRGIKKANFYVLKYNSLPAVLVEVGFMSNPEEARKLMDPVYQKTAAQGIAKGIRIFLENYNKSRGFTK